MLFFSLGPKGVINDWRKFKLESKDRDALPLSKKEILIRQMSSPYRAHSRDDKDTRERFSRKVKNENYNLNGTTVQINAIVQTKSLYKQRVHSARWPYFITKVTRF